MGIVPIEKARDLARESGLDLVVVAPTSKPPVCKLLDFGKYKYEISKKEKDSKKKQHVIVVKEIRMRPRTEDHDLEFKLKHARKFLEQRNKVKFTIQFRGREMAYKELGAELMDKVIEKLDDIAKVEGERKFEGRSLTVTMIAK